ncbi:tetratricopeptide repeat protein [Kiloniella laminariae]|uniref:Tetratricopeptide repeat protein 38 n=1 Tax=Kiloniella laminariae TaxID=454162 RepID=A0ABT4LP96_9PROT|nr:tetratricopeptide repeat protein [Kiloniella laminariae]MCZ4282720.1 tetratricopeptide repeat protein [Kiloniella laminariae]
MSLSDCRGIPVSYGNPDAIKALEEAHLCTMTFFGDPISMITKTLEEHPDFVMGHCFKAAWLTQTLETRIYRRMLSSLEAAEALWDKANERERGHIKAVRAWVDGDFFAAVQHWEAVLTRYPLDLLALQLVHLADVLLGDVVGQRDCVARVFALWDEDMPGYEFVLGFYSFGLEENSDYLQAEEMGRLSLAIRPDNPYAVHSVSHVMEMQGRQAGGISFMRERAPSWSRSHFANHLWWHLSLFHLDVGQVDRVLDIYDNNLRTQNQTADKYEELDAAALLWRLKLLGVDVGDRWTSLADKWEPSAEDTLYAFNDVHAMMTFVSDGRTEAAQRLLNANERYIGHATDANVAMSREIGLPFCLALQDFEQENYGSCVDRLLAVRYMTHRLGGSHAQRDIIGWTLLEAALRARRFDLALALANERCALKKTSVQNWTYVARAHKGLGHVNRAARAEARALSLTTG